MAASARTADPMRHTYSLRAIPLELLTDRALSDLSWLLDDDSIRNSYISLLVLVPVLLVFQDSLSEPKDTFEPHTSQPIH
jgi:hypothetical protein